MNDVRPCVVFDLDDTLFLERDYVYSGFDAVGTWVRHYLGLERFADDAWQLFVSGRRETIFNDVLWQRGRVPSPDLVQQMVNVYRTHVPRITILPDAARCLDELHPHADLALVTDGPLTSQRHKCNALRIRRFFQVIVFTDTWGPLFWKPHRRAFEYVQRRMHAAPTTLFYVADNPRKDFLAPRSLGWNTVRVRRPLGLCFDVDATSEGSAHLEIADLSDLAGIVSGRPASTVRIG
jgi:putative hydrolase of the HAD superfamily